MKHTEYRYPLPQIKTDSEPQEEEEAERRQPIDPLFKKFIGS
ncbi:hypothetical protein [Melghirimyces algeriensis]|uniref:Uncharacterized protein n=1 Tax=Melghirimyces algeriensis TaxID=910412 RepID=A0A521F788_9BACL|nr:hypothetical protein [Melghirimyces algeriensis]SMO92078.1 hypothetical protein SAMN06264849_11421 [Melghirimyces algeriensis]